MYEYSPILFINFANLSIQYDFLKDVFVENMNKGIRDDELIAYFFIYFDFIAIINAPLTINYVLPVFALETISMNEHERKSYIEISYS